jgi:DNA-binding XRE family transcriptional regulator
MKGERMSKEKIKIRNRLVLARMRLRMTRKHVARLLQHRSVFTLAAYKQGTCCPSLATALKLEVIYRQPIAFLWPELYAELRQQIRQKEAGERRPREVHHVR